MIFTHISARVPGPEHHFLINPYGFYFEEITASSLVKVDLEGNIVQETTSFINPAGFTIHSAIHGAREDAHFVIHLHTVAGVGVAAQQEGLLPIGQNACLLQHQVAYHGYEGLALNHDERERLVADLGDKPLMLLRNHGTMAVGDELSVYGEIAATGTTSLTIAAEAIARERNGEVTVPVAKGVFKFVLLDDDNRPRAVVR